VSRIIHEEIAAFIKRRGLLCIVKAPPGSGKSYNLLEAISGGIEQGLRICIAAQTNNQVDDLCTRFAQRYPRDTVYRYSSSSYQQSVDFPANVVIITKKQEIPDEPCTVIATCSKLGFTTFVEPFDVLLVDEAWQMTWSTFLTIRDASTHYVLIGDPGQIPPTVTIDCDRWETCGVEPHYPAPAVLAALKDLEHDTTILALDVCRRLPHDSVELVQTFYDFPFVANAQPGERFLKPTTKGGDTPEDRAINLLMTNSTVILTYPTDESGAPIETDHELARHAAAIAARLLNRKCRVSTTPKETSSPRLLTPDDIGIVSTHNQMNASISAALSGDATGIRVTTPERWQGLERAVMIAIHPLSGVAYPSSFDLETGRLCVMASRHQSACIFVSRDHVSETLATRLPVGDHAIGAIDVSGRGHAQHTRFWNFHLERGLIID